MGNEVINPRETKEYKGRKAHYDRMSVEMLMMAMIYEIYRDMKYKNALALPGRSPRAEEYALDDAVRQRL